MSPFFLLQPRSGIVQKIDAQVEKSRREIVSRDTELAQQSQTLKLAEMKKTSITQGFPNIRKNLKSSEKTVTHLLSQKKNLEEQLKVKEDEMQFFRESSTEQKQWLNKLISQKEEEIARLQKELTRVTTELNRASSQINEYEAQIRKIQSVLSKMSEEIKSLRDANAQKKQELDLKRKEVDQLRMQQTAAKDSNDKYNKKTTVRNDYKFIVQTCIQYYSFLNVRH